MDLYRLFSFLTAYAAVDYICRVQTLYVTVFMRIDSNIITVSLLGEIVNSVEFLFGNVLKQTSRRHQLKIIVNCVKLDEK